MAITILPSGKFLIINANNKNSADLPDDRDGQSVQGASDDYTDRFKWVITKLSNGRYIIKHAGTGNYAYVGDRPGTGTQIVGRASPREWRIQGTGVTNRYTIAPSDQDNYWGLFSDTSGTPIELRTGSTDNTNQWDIRPTQ